MKNHVQPGNTITLTAPYAFGGLSRPHWGHGPASPSGDGLLVGAIFGVASGAAALGEPVEAVASGAGDTIDRVRLNAALS